MPASKSTMNATSQACPGQWKRTQKQEELSTGKAKQYLDLSSWQNGCRSFFASFLLLPAKEPNPAQGRKELAQ